MIGRIICPPFGACEIDYGSNFYLTRRRRGVAFPTAKAKTGVRILLYDTSCHLYISTDHGATFSEVTNVNGDWNDMNMAVNDGDYSTMAAWEEVSGTVTICTPETCSPANPKLPLANSDSAVSGAITAGAGIMLAAIMGDFMQISHDVGHTWANVAGAPSDFWQNCCFSAGAAAMYAIGTALIYKSTDGGTVWNTLGAGPTGTLPNNFPTCYVNCSTNGQTVAATSAGFFYISRDGGTTWASTDFLTKAGGISVNALFSLSFGMAPDGSKFLLGLTVGSGALFNSPPFTNLAWVSSDGLTWTQVFPPDLTNTQNILYACNVAIDGQGMVIALTPKGQEIIAYADVSLNGGTTWAGHSIALDELGQGTTGEWVHAYMLPH